MKLVDCIDSILHGGKVIIVPNDIAEKIKDFCIDELDWHIYQCEAKKYEDETECELFLLNALGYKKEFDQYSKANEKAILKSEEV